MAEPALKIEAEATEAAAAPAAAPVLDTKSKMGGLDLASSLKAIALKTGRSYNQILVEIVKLNFGPGRVSVEEYVDLGLYDDRALAGADKRGFVGVDAMRELWKTINFRSDWYGLLENKLAATTLLEGFGFPVVPTLAVYSESFSLPALRSLRSTAELADFLREPANYPLFGKPADSLQSLGSASLDAYDRAGDEIVLLSGARVAVATFAAEVAASYRAGYLLQKRVAPHAAIRAVCGERLATCRIMTALSSKGVEAIRALWKIPAGGNVADNFWRAGNMLGALDLATGKVTRVQRGAGPLAQELDCHPDTGARITGMTIPNFAAVKELAIAAHRTLKDVRLLGWDIAAVEGGAVIVEPNVTPDFFLPQLIDRRGFLDDGFKAFIAECQAEHAVRRKAHRQEAREEYRARRKRAMAAALDA
jgi:hypothetical protein